MTINMQWLGLLGATFVLVTGAQVPAQYSGGGRPTPFEVDATWPQKPTQYKWAKMPGVSVDAQDRIYIFTRSAPSVQVYEPDGRFVRAWHTEDMVSPHHIQVDPEGNVWVTDFQGHLVQKYTPEGKLLLTLGTRGEAGRDGSHFGGVTDVAVLRSGDVFISDGYHNRRIAHFDKHGKFIKDWGSQGRGPGQFALPHGIAADSRERLYVADRDNARVQVFDTNGNVLAVWEDVITPWGVFVDKEDNIWVCGSSPVRRGGGWAISPPPDQLVMKFDAEGRVLLKVPFVKNAEGTGKPGEVNWLHGIALDSQGNLYVGTIEGQRAQKFVPRNR